MQTPVLLACIHDPVILPYIPNTVDWIYIIRDIVSQLDTTKDIIQLIDNSNTSWFSDLPCSLSSV